MTIRMTGLMLRNTNNGKKLLLNDIFHRFAVRLIIIDPFTGKLSE
jgi:hypothetical protein